MSYTPFNQSADMLLISSYYVTFPERLIVAYILHTLMKKGKTGH